MYYYHLRFNIYPAPGAPVEKEDWLILNTHHNEQQLKRLLVDQHQADVTLIVALSICKEEYDSKKLPTANALSRILQVSFKNITEWSLAKRTYILKKLNDDSDANEIRYKNIRKPSPLL